MRIASSLHRITLAIVVGMFCSLSASFALAGAVQFSLDPTQQALGFKSTGVYDPINIYQAGGGYGVAFLVPPLPFELPLGGTDGGFINFQTKLNAAQGTYVGAGAGKWSYAAGGQMAANSIKVTAYDVHGGADYVGIDGNLAGTPPTVGLTVKLTNPPAGNVHWVQVIHDNHNITGNHGDDENIIDNGNAATPYYDTKGAADGTNFFDAPRRDDPTNSHIWVADLYVATGPNVGPGAITLYNGFAYGWANIWVNTTNIANFANQINTDLSNITNLDNVYGDDLTDYFDQSQLDTLDEEFNEDLPEPGSVAMIAFVAFPLLRRSRGR